MGVPVDFALPAHYHRHECVHRPRYSVYRQRAREPTRHGSQQPTVGELLRADCDRYQEDRRHLAYDSEGSDPLLWSLTGLRAEP
jgi:hypothetical protein